MNTDNINRLGYYSQITLGTARNHTPVHIGKEPTDPDRITKFTLCDGSPYLTGHSRFAGTSPSAREALAALRTLAGISTEDIHLGHDDDVAPSGVGYLNLRTWAANNYFVAEVDIPRQTHDHQINATLLAGAALAIDAHSVAAGMPEGWRILTASDTLFNALIHVATFSPTIRTTEPDGIDKMMALNFSIDGQSHLQLALTRSLLCAYLRYTKMIPD